MNALAATQRKGWFVIPDVQDGDRTLEEQMIGITPALAGVAGKTVLDLGCAEGLIGREFARAGASVHGIDSVAEHIAVAWEQCAGLPMTFEIAKLDKIAGGEFSKTQYDIVLALGIAHKLHDPERFVRFVARKTKHLAIIRLSGRAQGTLMRSKQGYGAPTVDVAQTMPAEGFRLEKALPGPRGESVHYWVRL